jgi:hypothetical protein
MAFWRLNVTEQELKQLKEQCKGRSKSNLAAIAKVLGLKKANKHFHSKRQLIGMIKNKPEWRKT